MIFYIACTPDKYELPLFVAESAAELGDMLGLSRERVLQYISRTKMYNRQGRPSPKMLRYYKVITEDGERCPNCARLFYPENNKQIYCSKRCRHAASRERNRNDIQR